MTRMLPRRAIVLAVCSGPCLSLANSSSAETIAVWGGGSGNWGVSTKWNGGVIPNNGSPAGVTYAVQVDNNANGTSRVTISGYSYAVNSLRIDAGDAVQLLTDSSKLTLGRMTNAGTLTIASTSTYSGSSLLLDAAAFTLGGGGTVALTGGTISPASATGTVSLTIADQTLSGYGRVERASLANQGTIRANAGTNSLGLVSPGSDVANDGLIEADGSTLSILARGVTNRASMVARNGGTLSISATSFTQSATAQFVADAGKIVLTAPFANSRPGALTLRNGGSATFSGGFTNAGQVLLADAGSTLTFKESPVNNGGGTLRAQLTGNLNFAGAQVDNRAGRIELAGNAVAVLGASGSASGAVDNAGGTIDLRDDARFTVGGSVLGGTLTSSGNAAFDAPAGGSYARFSDVTLAGTLNVGGTGGFTGTIRNQGTINVTATGSLYADSERTELTGGGTVNLAGSLVRTLGANPPHTLVNRDNTLVVAGGGVDGLENHALVRVDSAVRLANVFNDADGTVRISAGGSATVTGPVTGTGTFELQSGASLTAKGHIDVPAIRNAGSILVTTSAGVSVGDLTGGGDLWIRSFGNVSVGNLDAGQLNVEWPATLTLRPTAAAPTAPRAGRVRGIQFTGPGAGKVDLTDRGLVVDYDPATASPLSSLAANVAAAYHSQYGVWKDGPITSANAAADPANLAVGYAEASAVLGLSGAQTALFLGQTVDASTVLLRTTLLGDANLDGTANFDDLLVLAKNYNSTAATWPAGDFNYDNAVNFDDLLLLAKHYNGQFANTSIAALSPDFRADLAAAIAQVPEPTALLGVIASTLLLARRRRVRATHPRGPA